VVGGGLSVANEQPGLGLNYLITENGVYSSRDSGQISDEPEFGDIRLFAGDYPPGGFALCQGQLLPINQDAALVTLVSTFYGGNGTTTFALPDLQGRVAVAAGEGAGLPTATQGLAFGHDSIALTTSQVPTEVFPLPVLALSVKADSLTVNAGGTAGFTVTVSNSGPSPSVAAAATLNVPLPPSGGANLWSINTSASGTTPGDFKLVGTAGNQMLELKAAVALPSNLPLAVDVIGVPAASGAPTTTLKTRATLDSPDVTVRNLTGSATITVLSQVSVFTGLSSPTIT
jgi:uncharacterized repeat protein (TIGR01451 family)